MLKNPLTIHILTKDSEPDVLACLKSIQSLPCNILVGDLGSKDKTTDLCRMYGAKIVRLSLGSSLARLRNELANHSETPWNLWVQPYEVVIGGQDQILTAMTGVPKCFNVQVIQGDLLTKPLRMWHSSLGVKFKNHAFEAIDSKGLDIQAFLASSPTVSKIDLVKICSEWHDSSPVSPEPLYYLACAHLQRGNNEAFLNYAEAYLHQEKKQQMSYFMILYYMAMVICYVKKDYKKSLEHILPCLMKSPTMAEFWCIAGDIFYAAGDYKRAISFYENAIVLGSRRRSEHPWPMEISKYKEYPEKMLESSRKLMNLSKVYLPKGQ